MILIIGMDTLTPLERSERMSHVRGKDTKPELLVRHLNGRISMRLEWLWRPLLRRCRRVKQKGESFSRVLKQDVEPPPGALTNPES
jgi:hypothetical protein